MATKETEIVRLDASTLNLANNTVIPGDVSTAVNGMWYNFVKSGNGIINGLVETMVDSSGRRKRVILPRPSIANATGFPTTVTNYRSSSPVRAGHYWDKTNQFYTYVIRTIPDGAIYADSTAIQTGISRLDPVGGDVQVGFTEFYDGTNFYLVFANATARPYYISTSNVVTQIADVDCPSGAGTCPYPVYMDGALFVAKNNLIHNSEFGAIATWPGYSRALEQYPGNVLALAKHKNSIVAFTAKAIEFFYNAGYSGTSPLARQETYASRVGIWTGSNNQKAFVELNDEIFFISVNNGTNIGLSKISNFKIQKVSTPYIDKILRTITLGGSNLMSVAGFNYVGHTIILITHYNSNKNSVTLVYDATEDFWSVWTQRLDSTVGEPSFQFDRAVDDEYVNAFFYEHTTTTTNGLIYGWFGNGGQLHSFVHDATTSTTFANNASPHYDYGSTDYPVDFRVQYSDVDFGTANQKHLKRLFVVNLHNASSGTRPDISVYVNNSSEITDYPPAIVVPSFGDSLATNLSTGRKFTITLEWSAGYWSSFDGLELQYNMGEQ